MAVDPFSPLAETFRILRTNIRFSSADRPLRARLVTSPDLTEGKSLAVAMAQAGLRVMAVDADLRRPWLHQLTLRAELGEGNAGGGLHWSY